MDGIVFWGPILIHTFTDSDSGTGAHHCFQIRDVLALDQAGTNVCMMQARSCRSAAAVP